MQTLDNRVEYRPVPDFDNYLVGSDGTVWSNLHVVVDPGRGFKIVTGDWKLMHPRKEKSGAGYLGVTLTRGKEMRWHVRVHVLVMFVFCGKREKGIVVRHLDGNPDNNCLDNLAYGTHADNMQDMIRHGRTSKVRGVDKKLAKLDDDKVRAIRREYVPFKNGFRALGEKYGVGKTIVEEILAGKRWKHVKDDPDWSPEQN